MRASEASHAGDARNITTFLPPPPFHSLLNIKGEGMIACFVFLWVPASAGMTAGARE